MKLLSDVVFGACVGDAVGAQLEFIKRWPIPAELVIEALKMKGGGFLDLAPGQITDDGELTICLARALMENKDPMTLYKKWLDTSPIDVGITTRNALRSGLGPDTKTEANGALMRVSPIPAFFCKSKTLFEIAELAREDARRTHASMICQEANAVYAVALAHVLLHKQPQLAVEEALWHTKDPTIIVWIEEAISGENLILNGHANDNLGWVRWGLMLSFHHLYYGRTYEDAITDVITRGGDTDTNAAITGALLVAYWGIDGIPKKWLNAVCKCSVRPKWLRPSELFVTT